MIYVLDACALIAYLNGEPGKEIVKDLLKKAVDGQASLYMSIINLMEVHYGYIRDLGPERAQLILNRICAIPLTIVDTISETVLHEATRLKASYKCSLADTIGLATAASLSGYFVSTDHHELDLVEKAERIPFLWVR